MSPSCITGPSPSIRMNRSPLSPPKSLSSSTSLASTLTSVKWTPSDSTGCTTAVCICWQAEERILLDLTCRVQCLQNGTNWTWICKWFSKFSPSSASAGPLTLLDQCTFEYASICGMIQASTDDADWIHTKSTVGAEDHTLLGKCRGLRRTCFL